MTESRSDRAPFVSYAQNREDVVLWRALHHVTPGRYVDVGAADPVVDSVSLALYERGWRGIDIEPVSEYADALRAARPGDVVVECGIGAEPGEATLTIVEGTGWSTFDSTVLDPNGMTDKSVRGATVAIRTLDDVLSDVMTEDSPIHVLKIDVEGLELDVLRGANLQRWRPWVLVVEATEPGSTRPSHEKWEPLVERSGYVFCLFDGLNRFYIHEEHPELRASLSYPACVLDQPFEHRVDRELRRELDESRAEIERRQHVVDDTVASYESVLADHRTLLRTHDALAASHRSAFLTHEELGRAHRALAQSHESLAQAHHLVVADRDALARAHRDLAVHAEHLRAAHVQATSSVSWRVTAPLRAVRGLRVRRGDAASPEERDDEIGVIDDRATSGSHPAIGQIPERQLDAFERRLRQGATVLLGHGARSAAVDEVGEEPGAITVFVEALVSSDAETMRCAWLSCVVATGRYPDESTLRSEDRLLRRVGRSAYGDRIEEMFTDAFERGQVRPVGLDPVVGAVAVDVTHTAQHDLQTGIQRVVRETCSRWLDDERMVPVWWDYAANGLRRLGAEDVDRFRRWREHLSSASGTPPVIHLLEEGPTGVVVPWGSQLVLPELAAEPERTEGYRSLACSGVIERLSVIGYDIIPVTAAETVTEGMSHRFSLYLSMVKRADRVAAISGAAADDFRAFNAALASQGLSGPLVGARLLPPSPTTVDEGVLVSVREQLGLGRMPMVLVVGSHEPRKNHLVVLEAAEQLWSDDLHFDLVFIGGSGWRSEPFDLEIERLQALGRSVQVRRGATEPELWAAYRLARFSVFPSLVEGYGLPIVESIASGTPVITTEYGSMAEVAVGGGALLIDPYDAGMLADRMRRLLVDTDELDRLRSEAADRRFPSWDEYAADVWQFFVGD